MSIIPKVRYSDGPLFGLGSALAVKVRVRVRIAYVRNSGPSE